MIATTGPAIVHLLRTKKTARYQIINGSLFTLQADTDAREEQYHKIKLDMSSF